MNVRPSRLGLALALVLAVLLPATAYATHTFSDVEDGRFYTEPVAWAAENGITSGRTPTIFDPHAAVTRAEVVTFLHRYDNNIVGQSHLTYDVGDWSIEPHSLGTNVMRSNGMVLGPNGTPLIGLRDSATGDLKTYECSNPSCREITTHTVDGGGQVGGSVGATVGANGLPMFVFRNSTFGFLSYRQCTNTSCTASNIRDLGPAWAHTSAAITTNAGGDPVIAYLGATNLKARLAFCSNEICSGYTETELPFRFQNSIDVVINGLGQPVVTYRDDNTDAAMVYGCTDATCTSGTATSLAASGNSGSVVIADDGFPALVFQDSTSVKLRRCTNHSCSTGSTTTLYTGSVGGGATLALGHDGNLVALTQANGHPTLFRCNDPACSTFSTHQLDPNSQSSNHSLAIAPDGAVLASWYDGWSTWLEVSRIEMSATGIGFD